MDKDVNSPVKLDLNLNMVNVPPIDQESDLEDLNSDLYVVVDTPNEYKIGEAAFQNPAEIKEALNHTIQEDIYRNDLEESMVTTLSEIERYRNLGSNLTATGMIQSTIYHIRKYGQNIYDPKEQEKYYNEEFLTKVRHINEAVEEELVDFK